jgi:penicillin-binding protein 2
MYSPIRIAALFIVIGLSMVVYVSALYTIQIHQPSQLDSDLIQRRIITRTSTITAARGNIYDRNGVLLASGKPSYNVMLDWWALRGSPDTNNTVLELIYAVMDEGFTYNDSFPVTRGAPFEFTTNMTNTQRNRLDAYIDYHDALYPDISVSDLLAWMRDHYRIDYRIGILDARLIIGVRYELEVRAIIGTIPPYVFASEVSTDFISYIEERGFNGVYFDTSFVREYHTEHAPHILGYIGRMTAEEYAVYREFGYPMDAVVGKIGAERAFEMYLHGVDGQQTIRFNDEGTVLQREITKVPEPGQHVYLTIDHGLQIATEHALKTQIDRINLERQEAEYNEDEDEEMELIPGGAVVVTDVRTGEVLAAASYPTFSLTTLSNDWAFLNSNPDSPMLNRATHGIYTPGSTFKMVTAFAALRDIPAITKYRTIEDRGRFTQWEDAGFVASCWIYTTQWGNTHGEVNVVQAIECSCNYYFLQVASWFRGGAEAGARTMSAAALEFGLGSRTGLEISESPGRLPLPEEKERLFPSNDPDRLWYTADSLQVGFGQGISRFTPVQLANYAATIGNGGTLYSLSILRRVMSSDFTEPVLNFEPTIRHQIEELEYIDILQEGMLAASRGNRGTARSIFGNYRILVASKTGTVQAESQRMNDGVFVCYAPADDPQIAISVVVEKGGSGSAIMDIARMIFDHYFVTESTFFASPYGQMIP